jgi:uncharacterized protein
MTNKYSTPEAAKDVFKAVLDEDLANLRFFFTDGADPDLKNEAGLTLLHVAVTADKLKSAEFLLNAGADPNQRGGPAGYSALHFASYKNRPAIAKQLIAHGAELESTDSQFMTPLQGAAFMGHKEMCEVLAEAGADVKRKDAFGHSPANIAQQRAGENWDETSKRFIDASVYLLSVERNGVQAQQVKKAEEKAIADHEKAAQNIEKLRSYNPQRFKLKPPGR